MIVNISEAKTNLSKLVAKACYGEEIIIAKNNLPLVEIVPYKPKGKRTLGILAGKIELPYDIMAENKTINEMFYGQETAGENDAS